MTSQNYIGDPEWCDLHGPTDIVDWHLEGQQERTGEQEYQVVDYACGCQHSWPVSRTRRQTVDEYYDRL